MVSLQLLATRARQNHSSTVITKNYFNPAKKGANIILSNSNMTAAHDATSSWQSVFALQGTTVGSGVYLEYLFSTTGGLNFFFGIGNSSSPLGGYCGSDANGWGLSPQNVIYHNGASIRSWAPVSNGQVVGIAISSSGNLYAAVNNSWVGGSTPGSGATALISGLSGTLFPIASVYTAGTSGTIRLYSSDFTYAPPPGYSPWN